jgi:23S rRNA A2030 N6-methylase RlmJ
MHAFINVNKKRTGSEIPAYVALVKEKKSLETLVATVRAPVDEHTFLVSAANLISYYAGDIAVVSFDYRRTDKTLIVELESASYDAMSAFLKNVRDEGVFSKVTPLSSDNAKAAGKEVIHFKVELVR